MVEVVVGKEQGPRRCWGRLESVESLVLRGSGLLTRGLGLRRQRVLGFLVPTEEGLRRRRSMERREVRSLQHNTS